MVNFTFFMIKNSKINNYFSKFENLIFNSNCNLFTLINGEIFSPKALKIQNSKFINSKLIMSSNFLKSNKKNGRIYFNDLQFNNNILTNVKEFIIISSYFFIEKSNFKMNIINAGAFFYCKKPIEILIFNCSFYNETISGSLFFLVKSHLFNITNCLFLKNNATNSNFFLLTNLNNTIISNGKFLENFYKNLFIFKESNIIGFFRFICSKNNWKDNNFTNLIGPCIVFDNNIKIEITNSNFSYNFAKFELAGIYFAKTFSKISRIILTKVMFIKNEAKNSTFGVALYFKAIDNIKIYETNFYDNKALSKGSPCIYVNSLENGNLLIYSCNFTENKAFFEEIIGYFKIKLMNVTKCFFIKNEPLNITAKTLTSGLLIYFYNLI